LRPVVHCTGVAEAPGKVVPIRDGLPRPEAVPLDTRDDDELLLLTRGGRGDAFAVLVRRHQQRGLRIAHKYLGDLASAKDVVQATFVEIYRALPRYQPRGQFPAFFHRVLLNQCRMTHRARFYAKRAREDARTTNMEHAPASDDLILARERRTEVERAVRRLSHKLRDVVVLRFAGDLAYEEIADALGLPIGTVKSRLAAGIERLTELLDREVQ
jgi:RNA polymerase sigma-70 factor (ECF subfamily)